MKQGGPCRSPWGNAWSRLQRWPAKLAWDHVTAARLGASSTPRQTPERQCSHRAWTTRPQQVCLMTSITAATTLQASKGLTCGPEALGRASPQPSPWSTTQLCLKRPAEEVTRRWDRKHWGPSRHGWGFIIGLLYQNPKSEVVKGSHLVQKPFLNSYLNSFSSHLCIFLP